MRGDTGARSAIFITSIITSTSNNRLRVTDAPGVYAAFPWGGYAQEKGATGTRSNAIGARALYSPLSPPASSYTWPFIRARCDIDRAVHRGPPPGAFRRGGQFSTRANSGNASNTKGPLRRKTCTPKTAMTPVVATIRLRRSSPRSRGPPSQSESYVWDKALICRRPGESNSSI